MRPVTFLFFNTVKFVVASFMRVFSHILLVLPLHLCSLLFLCFMTHFSELCSLSFYFLDFHNFSHSIFLIIFSFNTSHYTSNSKIHKCIPGLKI